MPGISSKIKELVGGESVNKWAEDHGLPKQTVHEWIRNDRMPRGAGLKQLIEATGIPEEWWRSGEGPPPVADKSYAPEPIKPLVSGSGEQTGYQANDRHRSIPEPELADLVFVNLYDVRASGGHGAWNERERVVSRLAFTRSWVRNELNARPDRLALIYVDGDSMEPTLKHGDIILVNQDENSLLTDGIYVFMLNDHLMVKTLQRIPGRKVRVISDNPAFDSYELDDDFEDADQYIIGRVVWTGRKM